MRHLTLFALLASMMAPATSDAATRTWHHKEDLGTLLTNTDMSAVPDTTRTFTFTNPDGKWGQAVLKMNRTRSAGTNLTMTCTHGAELAQYDRCEWTAASGECKYYQVVWTSATSSTEVRTFEVDVKGKETITCIVASASADGSDTLIVTGTLVSQ